MSLAKQAMLLTLGNGLTRGLGFLLRLLLARWMGAEALGVMEMANSVSMLALTPVTAGIPAAMSRLTALQPQHKQPTVLASGLRFVRRMAWLLIPLLALLSPVCAWLLGDLRSLPAMWLGLPSMHLLGLCSVYTGYCYGTDKAALPALAECAEQGTRCLLTVVLVLSLRQISLGMRSALPAVAEVIAGVVVVAIFRRTLPLARDVRPSASLEKQLFRLSTPSTLSRLCLTGARALEAMLLPVCLRRSGLSATAATAQYGLLTGMVLPSMMLPGIVTSALCMVTAPAVTRAEGSGCQLQRTMRRLMLPTLAIGAGCALVLLLGADLIANRLYHTPELAPLLRLISPCALLFALHQVQMGMVTGLGLQRKALTGTLISSCVRLVTIALLVPQPQVRLFGAVLATALGQLVTVVYNGALLKRKA